MSNQREESIIKIVDGQIHFSEKLRFRKFEDVKLLRLIVVAAVCDAVCCDAFVMFFCDVVVMKL